MPNYNLQINSQFRPMSFKEYMQPLMMAQQRHDQLENTLSQYDSKAAEFMRYANSATDKEEIAKYQQYAQQLHEVANNLSTKGIMGLDRKSSWKIKQQYDNEIAPLVSAAMNRNNIIREQRQLKTQDPSLIFNDASTEGLKTFVDNPNYTYTPYSGKLIMAMAAQGAAKLATTDRGTLLKHITPSQLEYVKQHGYDMDSVFKVINDSPDKDALLSEVLQNTMEASGLRPEQGNLYKQGLVYGKQGILQAIGQNTSQIIDDKDYLMDKQFEQNKEMAKLNSDLDIKKMKTKLGDPIDDPTADLSHWGGETEADPELQSAGDTAKKMMGNYNGSYRGIKKEYVGKGINPMKIYEEAQHYIQTNPTIANKYKLYPFKELTEKTQKDIFVKDAEAFIAKKYGLNLISEQDYNNLKAMGYTSSSKLSDFGGTNLMQRVNTLSKDYRNSSVNLSGYENVTNRVNNNLSAWKNNDNFAAHVYEYNSGHLGKSLDYDDVVKTNKNDEVTSKVSNVSYSIRQPNKIIVQIDGKPYYMDPTVVSSEAKNIVDSYSSRIAAAKTSKQKSDLQDLATKELSILLNNYQKVRSNTDSNI